MQARVHHQAQLRGPLSTLVLAPPIPRPLLPQAQDGTPAFRQLVQSSRDDELRSAMAALWLMPAQPARVHPNAQRIVVFVVANAVGGRAARGKGRREG